MADFYLHPEKIGGNYYLAPLTAPNPTPPTPDPSLPPTVALYSPMRATGINLYSKLL